MAEARGEGIVTVTESASATGVFARDGSACGLRRGGDARDLAPGGEAGLQQLVVSGSGKEVPAGAAVVRDRAEGAEELLRVVR